VTPEGTRCVPGTRRRLAARRRGKPEDEKRGTKRRRLLRHDSALLRIQSQISRMHAGRRESREPVRREHDIKNDSRHSARRQDEERQDEERQDEERQDEEPQDEEHALLCVDNGPTTSG